MKMLDTQKIYALLTRLSKREKLVLYGTVIVVSVTVMDRLVIAPIFDKMRSLDKEIEDKETSIRRNQHILAQQNRILAESSKYDSLTKSLKSSEDVMTSFLKEIENLANKSQVYVVDLKPGDVKNLGSVKKYLANVNCEAQPEQLAEFMYSIENSNELLTIERYQISPKSIESSIAKCSMTISRTVVP